MIQLTDAERHINACVYGDPGSGKTSLGVSAPKPLVLLSERQGLAHIRQAAKRMGRPMPLVVYMQTRQDYRDVLRALRGDRAKPFCIHAGGKEVVLTSEEWPETVVFDSMTDAGRIFADEIRASMNLGKGKDGLEVLPVSFWGALKTEFSALITSFRDVEANTLFLCLADRQKEDEGKRAQLAPSMPVRSLAVTLAAAVNLCGYAYRTVKDGKYTYAVTFMAREGVMTKPYRPLRDVERPNFERWLQAINADEPAQEPDAELGVSEESV